MGQLLVREPRNGHSPATEDDCLMQSRNARKAVKAGIKAEKTLDPMLLHDGQVQRIARRHMPMPQQHLLRTDCGIHVDGEDVIDDFQDGVEGGLDRVAPVDCDITVQDFLKHFGVCNQAFPLADQLFQ